LLCIDNAVHTSQVVASPFYWK